MIALRSRGGLLIMRDGDGVARMVGNEWVLFKELPKNTPPEGDGDVEIKEVGEGDRYELAKPFVKISKPSPAEPEAKPETAKKPGRRGGRATLAATVPRDLGKEEPEQSF